MSISDAQFALWLKDQASKVTVLAELKFGYQSAGVPAEGTIYLSDRGYTSKPSDSPSSTRYRGVIKSGPDFQRTIDLEKLGGRGVISNGTLGLDNADGSLDFLLDAIIDGRDISFYIGDKDWPRADFRLINTAAIGAVKAENDMSLAVTVSDRSYLLDSTLVGDAIASGPNLGKPKPLLFGFINNFDITPYLVDAAALTYVFNSFPSSSYQTLAMQVRDAGVSLDSGNIFSGDNAAITANAGTDTVTRAGHGLVVDDVMYWTGATPFAGLTADLQYWVIAAGLTANDFRMSLTRGGAAVDITGTTFAGTIVVIRRRFYVDSPNSQLTLSSSPSGRVTIDLLAVTAGTDGSQLYVPHCAFRYIMDRYSQLTRIGGATAQYRDTAAFAALVTEESAAARYWGRAVTDRINAIAIYDEIALATNSWYGWTAAGLVSVGKLDLSNIDTATAIDTIGDDDIEDEPSCENLDLQFGKLVMDTDPNVVLQTDGLASSVSAANRSKWGQPSQLRVTTTDPLGSDYPNGWWTYHKTAIDSRPLSTALHAGTVTAVAQAACDERTNLFKPWTRVFRCSVGLDKYALNPGDCVTVTYPRYGLSAGKKFRVMTVGPKLFERRVDLVLVRQSTPDYTTSSYV